MLNSLASAPAAPASASSGPAPSRLAALLRLCRDPAGPAGLALAALLALAVAYAVFGLPFMRGLSSFWLREDGDITQYITGFNAFVREPWHWPLLRLESVNWPDGTLATFLDTVPLYALVLKLFAHGSGLPFRNPYPAWLMLCYLLQGAGAWWLCREARLRSWVALAVLTVLLATFPALTYRIHHTSLMSQWMLLFALALYVRGTRLDRLAGWGWTALLVLGFYVNIYLFCMASFLFAADLLRQWRRHSLLHVAPAALGAPLLLGLSLLVTMLPLASGGGGGEWGFGYYSMNLLAPFAGGKLLQWPHAIANGGQGEGFNYLGVFLLGFTLYALQLRRRHDPDFWPRHRALQAVLALLALYALSNAVYLGELLVLRLDLPEWAEEFTQQMRASGRFFWPVGYAVVVFTVITVQRYAGRWRAAALLLALAWLQLWDLQPHHEAARANTVLAAPSRIDQQQWNAFLGPDTASLQVYPPFGCGKSEATLTVLPAMRYAVAHQLPISSGYVARARKNCDNIPSQIARAAAPGTAFMFIKADFAAMEQAEQLLGGAASAQCVEGGMAWLCKRKP